MRYVRQKPGHRPERLIVVLWARAPYPEAAIAHGEAWGVVRYDLETGRLLGVATIDGQPVPWERQSWVEPELMPVAPEGAIPIEAAAALVEVIWSVHGWTLILEERPLRVPEEAPPRSTRRPATRHRGPCGHRARCAYHAGGGPYNEACRTTPPGR